MGTKKSKTTLRYRSADTGRLLTDKEGKAQPKNQVVRERLPKPGNGLS